MMRACRRVHERTCAGGKKHRGWKKHDEATATGGPALLMVDALPGMPSFEELLGGANNFTSNLTSTVYADVMGFYHAVDWSERWLLGLGAFHVFVWALAILTRNADEMQMVLLVAIRERR